MGRTIQRIAEETGVAIMTAPCDTYAAGPVSEGFFARPNVHSPGVSAGRTKQAFVLLSEKVLANLEKALDGSEETLQRL